MYYTGKNLAQREDFPGSFSILSLGKRNVFVVL